MCWACPAFNPHLCMQFALQMGMTLPLPILNQGSCEPFKAVVHGTALGLFALMGLYNAAAWINRRDSHLAVNAIVYGTLVAWERRLVAHHLERCRDQVEAQHGVTIIDTARRTAEAEGDEHVPVELLMGNRAATMPQVAA
jgi:hypothetical protein